MVLLHDDALWRLVDAWLLSLSAERFVNVLPMLRRTFTEFSAPERRQLAERARRTGIVRQAGAGDPHQVSWDEERAALVLPFLRTILGLAGNGTGAKERGAHE